MAEGEYYLDEDTGELVPADSVDLNEPGLRFRPKASNLDLASSIAKETGSVIGQGVLGAADWALNNAPDFLGYSGSGVERWIEQTLIDEEKAAENRARIRKEKLGDGALGTVTETALGVVPYAAGYLATGGGLPFLTSQTAMAGGRRRSRADLIESDPNVSEDYLATVGGLASAGELANLAWPANLAGKAAPLLGKLAGASAAGAVSNVAGLPFQVQADRIAQNRTEDPQSFWSEVTDRAPAAAGMGAATGLALGGIEPVSRAIDNRLFPKTPEVDLEAQAAQIAEELRQQQLQQKANQEKAFIKQLQETPLPNDGELAISGNDFFYAKDNPTEGQNLPAIVPSIPKPLDFSIDPNLQLPTSPKYLELPPGRSASQIGPDGSFVIRDPLLDGPDKTPPNLVAEQAPRQLALPGPKIVGPEGPSSFRSVDVKRGQRGAVINPVGEILELAATGKKKLADAVAEIRTKVTGKDPEVDLLDAANAYLDSGFRRKLTFPSTVAKKNPIFKAQRDVGIRYEQDFESNTHQFKRLGSEYFSLPKQSRNKIDDLFITMRLANKKLLEQGGSPVPKSIATPEWLKSKGLDTKEVVAAEKLLKASDLALDKIEEALIAKTKMVPAAERPQAEQGVKELVATLRDNWYFPATRGSGSYLVKSDVKGSEYNEVFASRSDAIKAKGQGPGRTIEQIQKTKNFDDNGLPPDLQVFLDEKGKFSMKNFAGFANRLKKFNAVEGFTRDLSPVWSDYFLGLSKWNAKSKADPLMFDLQAQHPPHSNIGTYANKWWQDVKRGAGSDASQVTRFISLYQLGGVASSGIINHTQNYTTTLAALVRSDRVGGLFKAAKWLSRAQKEAADYYLASYRGKTDAWAKKSPRNQELSKALSTAIDQGVIESQAKADLYSISQGKRYIEGRGSLADLAMLTFTIPEKHNRYTAFIAGFDVAKAKGLEGEAATKYAMDFVRETQFENSNLNRPELARNYLGRLAFQFRTFTGNYIRFMRDLVAEGEGKAALTSLGAMVGFAGLTGIPGVKLAMSVIDKAFDQDSEQRVREFIGSQKVAKAIMKGPANLLGVDISGAAGLGDPISASGKTPEETFFRTFLGPVTDFYYRGKRANAAMESDSPWIAAQAIAPRAGRGALRVGEQLATGAIRDMKGDPLIDNPTPVELAQIAAGFSPTRMTDRYEQKTAIANLTKRSADNSKINLRYAKALKAGDTKKAEAILQESLESLQLDPQYHKRIDMRQVKKYLVPETIRQLKEAPKEVRGMVGEIDDLFNH